MRYTVLYTVHHRVFDGVRDQMIVSGIFEGYELTESFRGKQTLGQNLYKYICRMDIYKLLEVGNIVSSTHYLMKN